MINASNDVAIHQGMLLSSEADLFQDDYAILQLKSPLYEEGR